MLFLEDCLPVLRKFILRSSLLCAAELEIQLMTLRAQHSLGTVQDAARMPAVRFVLVLTSECSRATKLPPEGLSCWAALSPAGLTSNSALGPAPWAQPYALFDCRVRYRILFLSYPWLCSCALLGQKSEAFHTVGHNESV